MWKREEGKWWEIDSDTYKNNTELDDKANRMSNGSTQVEIWPRVEDHERLPS